MELAAVRLILGVPTNHLGSASWTRHRRRPPPATWDMVMKALSGLRDEVYKLKQDRQSTPPSAPGFTVVNLGASTSRGSCRTGSPSPGSFSEFDIDYGSEDGELSVFTQVYSTVLLQGAKSFGPLQLISEEIDP